MKKLPQEFQSWVQFYDHLKSLHITTETICMYVGCPPREGYPPQSEHKPYSISMKTVERYAWQEIQKYRVSAIQTFKLQHAVEMGHNLNNPEIQEVLQAVNKLLVKLEKI